MRRRARGAQTTAADTDFLMLHMPLSVFIDGAACHSMVVVRMLHATIGALTEKAVRLDAHGCQVWYPRAVLQNWRTTAPPLPTLVCDLAPWFVWDHNHSRQLRRIEAGIVSAPM